MLEIRVAIEPLIFVQILEKCCKKMLALSLMFLHSFPDLVIFLECWPSKMGMEIYTIILLYCNRL